MDIENVKGRAFDQVETTTVSCNVDDIFSQIGTLQQRIAQLIANGHDDIKRNIAPVQNQIAALQTLLDVAGKAGVDITPPADAPDTTALIASLESTSAAAIAIASPSTVSVQSAAVDTGTAEPV